MFAIGTRLVVRLIFFLILLSPSLALSTEVSIFDVRNTLSLSDKEPTYKDYYINGGSEKGLRPGMVITVMRSIPLYDSYQNKSPGQLEVQVAKIKVIHVQKGLAVARDYAEVVRTSHPLLDYDFVMTGDHLDLNSAVMESKLKAEAEVPQPQPEPQVQKEVKAEITEAYAIDFASKAVPLPEVEPVPVTQTIQ